jgi:uncharacterized protein GlcG (DUF336 family)
MAQISSDKARLSAEGARVTLEAAIAQAGEMKIPISVAVVDDGGHLLAFTRMDGAAFASVDLAIDKARTAAGFGYSTGDFFELIKGDESLLHGLTAHGELALFAGAAPIVRDGAVLGAIGVSGGRGVDDVEVVQAALNAVA